jgi:hypothetical protein
LRLLLYAAASVVLQEEYGQDGNNLISSNKFWQVEARLEGIHEADSAQHGSGIEILTENGSKPIHFGSRPQLCVPKIKLMITDGAGGGQDHLGCYVENGPNMRLMLQFVKCFLVVQKKLNRHGRRIPTSPAC